MALGTVTGALMPKINLGYNELGNAELTPQRGLPDTRGLGADTRAMARFLEVGAETFAEIQANRQNVQLAKASTEAAKALEQKAFDFKHNDSDYTTQAERYNQFYNELSETYKEQLTAPGQFEQFQQNIDQFAFKTGLGVKSFAMQQDMAEQSAILDSTLDDLSGIAIRGDQEQYDESIAKGEGLIQHSLDIGVITGPEAIQKRAQFGKSLSRGKVRQDINLDPAIALENIRSGKYAHLSAEEQSQFESMAMSKIEQVKSASAAEAKKQATELVDDTKKAYEEGLIVTDEEFALAFGAAKALGKEEDLIVAKNAARYATMPKAQRDAILKEARATGGPAEAEQIIAIEKANDTIEIELNKDAYSFAVRQRVIEEVPLDLTNPATIQARIQQVEYLAQHYGRPVSPLTEPEAAALVEGLKVMNSDQKVALALTLGPNQSVWEQLDKKNAGLFAMTGAIGDEQVMKNVFIGEQLMRDKLVAPIKQQDFLPVFNDYVDDVYLGDDRRQMLDAATAYYAATTDSPVFDSGDFENAIEAVSGGIGKINGFKVELPRGTSEDDFEDYIDNFSAQTVADFGGAWGMSDEKAAAFIKDARIVSHASGQYMAVKGDAVLIGRHGQPFLFSFDPAALERDAPEGRQYRTRRQNANNQ